MGATTRTGEPLVGPDDAHVQAELPMPGLIDELKKKVNRPVAELALTAGASPEIMARPATLTRPSGASVLTNMISGQTDAPSCSNCGHITVRNGACYKCLNCGESLGCS